MFQSLLSLEDDQIEAVLAAVDAYCMARGFEPESSEGRQAIQKAIDILSERSVPDLGAELCAQLDEATASQAIPDYR